MSDIVERLRKWSVFGYGYEASCDMKEAAAAIEAQRANMANGARLLSEQVAEIERLRAALRPFADVLRGNWSHQQDKMVLDVGFGPTDLRLKLRLGDFRIARAALEGK